MDIVLIHLGDAVLPHMLSCIKQIRAVTQSRIVLALSNPCMYHFAPADNIVVVSVLDVKKTGTWAEFERLDFFERSGDLWEYSCERLFILEWIMELLGLDEVLHIENDNLIYAEPDVKFLRKRCGKAVGLTAITSMTLSAGVMYVGSRDGLNALNVCMNSTMSLGKEAVGKQYGGEMLNEMRLLKIVSMVEPKLIRLLPIFPTERSKYVYDCASWGQWVGGAFHAPGVPFAHDSHLAGQEINNGTYGIEIGNDRTPSVVDLWTHVCTPLFNLHIHSKDLRRWSSVDNSLGEK